MVQDKDCPQGQVHLVNGKPALWTVMHYASGDNNLEEVILEDINEMELGHQGSKNVNVVVQLDKESEPGMWRYYIHHDADKTKITSPLIYHSDEEPDSGDWKTLAYFGKWAVHCYPAEKYMLVIGGHGSGWSTDPDENDSASVIERHLQARFHGESLRSISPDDSHSSEIYINQLAKALDIVRKETKRPGDVPGLNRLVLYGSDACLMETFEVAYELRNTVTYLLGSEETEPGPGWPYNTIIRSLTQKPLYYAERPHELANLVVKNYGKSYGPGGGSDDDDYITFAAVDTAQIIRARNQLDKIALLMAELNHGENGLTLADAIWQDRDDAYSFGDGYVDLGLFLTRVRANLINKGLMPKKGQLWTGDARFKKLREAMDTLLEDIWPTLVVSTLSSKGFPEASGFSIFLPYNSDEGYGLDLPTYRRSPFAKDSAWASMLDVLLEQRKILTDVDWGKGTGTIVGKGAPAFELKNVPIECDLTYGGLNVRNVVDYSASDTECQKRYSVSLQMKKENGGLVLKSGSVYNYRGDCKFSGEAQNQDIAVSDLEIVDKQSYKGRVSLQIQDYYSDDKKIDLSFDFDCKNFIPFKYANGKGKMSTSGPGPFEFPNLESGCSYDVYKQEVRIYNRSYGNVEVDGKEIWAPNVTLVLKKEDGTWSVKSTSVRSYIEGYKFSSSKDATTHQVSDLKMTDDAYSGKISFTINAQGHEQPLTVKSSFECSLTSYE